MESIFSIRGVPSGAVPHFWDFASPYIKRALDSTNGEIREVDLRRMCEQRDAQLWLISDGASVRGAATTEIVVYPRKKYCRIITIAGSGFDEWKLCADKMIEQWAIAQGCMGMEAHVKKTFVQKLEELGYRHKYAVCIKEFESPNG